MTKGIEMACLIILPVISYFIGNISPATVIGRLYGVDIRKEGSGNPGTTNVLRTLGKKAAACTLLIDVIKGFLPVFIAGMAVSRLCAIECGTAALLGHMWPICYRFKGGKGVATGFGVALALDWRVGLTALLFAAAGVLLSKRMSVGSIAAAVSFPAAVYIFMVNTGWEPVWAVCMALLIIFKHRTNIVRLAKGEEPPLRFLSGKR